MKRNFLTKRHPSTTNEHFHWKWDNMKMEMKLDIEKRTTTKTTSNSDRAQQHCDKYIYVQPTLFGGAFFSIELNDRARDCM